MIKRCWVLAGESLRESSVAAVCSGSQCSVVAAAAVSKGRTVLVVAFQRLGGVDGGGVFRGGDDENCVHRAFEGKRHEDKRAVQIAQTTYNYKNKEKHTLNTTPLGGSSVAEGLYVE
jgi:hypothetical protein